MSLAKIAKTAKEDREANSEECRFFCSYFASLREFFFSE